MKQVKTVEEYIANAPKEVQSSLKKMRSAIKKAAPLAQEKISYGMPYYGYKGRLAYFSAAKNHIGLYIPPPIIEEHSVELKEYGTAKATIRFPLEKELPTTLITKLVKARVTWNDEKGRK